MSSRMISHHREGAEGKPGGLVGCSLRLQGSDIMACHDLDEGIRAEFAAPRGARRRDLRCVRWRAHRGAKTGGVSLSGRRAFGGDLWRTDRGDVCGSWYLAWPQADSNAGEDRCEGSLGPGWGTIRGGREETRGLGHHAARARDP